MWNPVWRTCKLNTVIPSSTFISHSPIIQASYLQPTQVPLKSYQVSWHCAASHHWVGKATNKVQPFHLCQRDQTLGSSDAVKLVSPHGLRSARRPAALSNTEGCLGCLAAYIYIHCKFPKMYLSHFATRCNKLMILFFGFQGDLWRSLAKRGALLIPIPKATVATTTWIWPSTQAEWTWHGNGGDPPCRVLEKSNKTITYSRWRTHAYIYIYIHMYWCIYIYICIDVYIIYVYIICIDDVWSNILITYIFILIWCEKNWQHCMKVHEWQGHFRFDSVCMHTIRIIYSCNFWSTWQGQPNMARDITHFPPTKTNIQHIQRWSVTWMESLQGLRGPPCASTQQ